MSGPLLSMGRHKRSLRVNVRFPIVQDTDEQLNEPLACRSTSFVKKVCNANEPTLLLG